MFGVDIALHGMTAIRYFSWQNDWLDFAVVVSEEDLEEAKTVVAESIEAYWDSDCDCYGDLVEFGLVAKKIRYMIFYHDTEDESPEYEAEWGALMTKLNCQVISI